MNTTIEDILLTISSGLKCIVLKKKNKDISNLINIFNVKEKEKYIEIIELSSQIKLNVQNKEFKEEYIQYIPLIIKEHEKVSIDINYYNFINPMNVFKFSENKKNKAKIICSYKKTENSLNVSLTDNYCGKQLVVGAISAMLIQNLSGIIKTKKNNLNLMISNANHFIKKINSQKHTFYIIINDIHLTYNKIHLLC